MLEGAGADLATLRLRLEQALRGLPKVPNGKVYLGDRVLRLLDIAQVEARERGAGVVSPLHLLVGIPLETRSPAAEVLRDAGLTLPKLEQAVAGAELPPASDGPSAPVGGGRSHRPQPPSTRTDGRRRRPPAWRRSRGAPGSLLAKYARDLTALAAAGKMDPVIGRDAETRRVLQILGRRSKNNPILIGDPGVGKTAVVEGLAIRIAHGDVPSGLADKRIFSLDVGSLIAGAKLRGEFEDRIRGLLAEVREAGGAGAAVPRRDPHPGGRRPGRRGAGRRRSAEAGAGPGRADLHRRHHHRRVPPAHREGSGVRAPLPAGDDRGADRGRVAWPCCAG